MDALIAVLALSLLIRPTVRRIMTGLAALVTGGLIGLMTTWVCGDVLDMFGVSFTPVTRMWVAIGFAGVALAVVTLFHSRWWRRLVAVASIPVFVIASGAGINVEFGEYRTLNDVLGVVPFQTLNLHSERGEVAAVGTDYSATWSTPASLPAKGEIGKVRIPATVSGFPARESVIYLPPAALVAQPPVLPVLYAFSGQPGAPSDVFTSGQLGALMDRFAANHDGLAPIVVAADQLGGPNRNPMCVDSAALGKSATYLLKDVPAWIKAHLRVSTDPAAWGVFGYSQGATCAVQFATAHPETFGSAIASSSQLAPTLGDQNATIAKGFGGSAAAYHAARPDALMTAHAPYKDTLLVLGVGQNDAKYMAYSRALEADAIRAGIATRLVISPGSAHDWHTVRHTLAAGFPAVAAHMGFGS